TSPGDQTSGEGSAIALQIAAVAARTFSATGLPTGLTIGPTTGLISGTIDRRGEGSSTVTITASDGTVSTDISFVWTVLDTTPPPPAPRPAGQNNNEGDPLTPLQIVAVDADSFSAAGLPAGLTIDPATGLISGTVGPHADGTYTVTVTAYDGPAGALVSSSVQFTWVVNDTTPPDLPRPADQTNNEGDAIAGVPRAAGGAGGF